MIRSKAAVGMPIAGLAWVNDWELPFEGPYSLMAKCAWANSVGATDLCALIFNRKLLNSNNVGRHGRSLLDMGWVGADNTLGTPYLRDRAVEASLASRAGRWTSNIASDHALRYCPSCLAHGYQSALYQIEGLDSCPIHHQRLVTACIHCRAAGQRYALTEAGFANPFHCPDCFAPLGSTFDPDRWYDADFRHIAYTRLAPIAQWLQKVSAATLKWHAWSEWYFPLRWHSSEQERHLATLDVLQSVVPPPSEATSLRRRRQAPQVYLGSFTTESGGASRQSDAVARQEMAAERMNLYKAMRRYVRRRLSGCKRLATLHLPDSMAVSHSDGAMLLSTIECPRPQVFGLWRYHFEEAQLDPHVLVLRPPTLQWPTGISDIGATAWCSYLLASFHAAVAAFDAWRKQAELLPDASLLGRDRARARALHANFAPLFSPSILPNFPAVTALTLMDEQHRPHVLIVGPPDISLSPQDKIGQGLHCRCKGRWGSQCSGNAQNVLRSGLATIILGEEKNISDLVNLAYFVPMDQLCLPVHLDGSIRDPQHGNGQHVLAAENDLEAISQWLDLFDNTATRRIYERNIEKALVWCVAQRGIALSRMSVDDVNAFTEFLANPMPRDVWLPSQTAQATRRWTPFRKAPSERSQGFTFQILALLFEDWSSEAYILHNPCRKSRVGQQKALHRLAEIPEPAKRDAQVTMKEWGYVVAAAGHPPENTSVCLLLYAAYFAALNPGEIGAIQLKDVRRVPSVAPGIDIWSFVIESRNSQRQEVFLMNPITTLLRRIFPASMSVFDAFVRSQPEAYLIDLLDPAPALYRDDGMEPVTGAVLAAWMNPVFNKAAHLASRIGDTLAARRLKMATLFWLTNALEKHLEQRGKTGHDCWNAIGACRLCPAKYIGYLPDRRAQRADEINRALNGVANALSDSQLSSSG